MTGQGHGLSSCSGVGPIHVHLMWSAWPLCMSVLYVRVYKCPPEQGQESADSCPCSGGYLCLTATLKVNCIVQSETFARQTPGRTLRKKKNGREKPSLIQLSPTPCFGLAAARGGLSQGGDLASPTRRGGGRTAAPGLRFTL